MPSITHQALASLFRENPALGLRLLESATDVSLPAGAQARLHAAQFTDLRPPEYAADAACLIEDDTGKVLGALIIEIQLSPDELSEGPAALLALQRNGQGAGAPLERARNSWCGRLGQRPDGRGRQ